MSSYCMGSAGISVGLNPVWKRAPCKHQTINHHKAENSKQTSLHLLTARAKRQARLLHINSPERNNGERGKKTWHFPVITTTKSHEGMQVLPTAAALPLPSTSCWFSTGHQDTLFLLWFPVLPLKGFEPHSGVLVDIYIFLSFSVCESQVKFHSSVPFETS